MDIHSRHDSGSSPAPFFDLGAACSISSIVPVLPMRSTLAARRRNDSGAEFKKLVLSGWRSDRSATDHLKRCVFVAGFRRRFSVPIVGALICSNELSKHRQQYARVCHGPSHNTVQREPVVVHVGTNKPLFLGKHILPTCAKYPLRGARLDKGGGKNRPGYGEQDCGRKNRYREAPNQGGNWHDRTDSDDRDRSARSV